MLMVGMAELKVAQAVGEVLTALGLGSCIGICAFDRQAGVAAMAHIVLPSSGKQISENPGKFADTAVPKLIVAMQKKGAIQSRIQVAIAGGAQLFVSSGSGDRMDIGPRNAVAVRDALREHRLSIIAEDVGGSSGRTVYMGTDGLVRVKTIGQGERQLVLLGGGSMTRVAGALNSALDPAFSSAARAVYERQ